MLGPLCNETVNLETDGKTLHYSLRKLFNANMGKNDTLFKDQDSQKTDPIGGGGTYLSVQYTGVGAPPRYHPPG